MRKLSPKPEVCQFCFNKSPYDLACIGEYNTDLMNWKWSCRSCHQKYDYTNGTRVSIRLFGKDNPFFDKKHKVEAREKMRGPRPSISGDKNPNFGKRPMFGKTHSEDEK